VLREVSIEAPVAQAFQPAVSPTFSRQASQFSKTCRFESLRRGRISCSELRFQRLKLPFFQDLKISAASRSRSA
jgi:hypothetical protein